MYSDLFSQKSVQDLLTVLPSLPLAVWETFYVTVVSTALSLVIGLPLGVLLVVGFVLLVRLSRMSQTAEQAA